MQPAHELPVAIFLEKALTLARRAESENEVPVGAVVVNAAGVVIGEGYNKKEQTHDVTAHAEIEALRAAAQKVGSWKLEACRLIVTLEPCLMCLAAIQASRIVQVIYGAEDHKGGALSLGYAFHSDVRLNHRFEVLYEPNLECAEILTLFFKQMRKKKGLSL